MLPNCYFFFQISLILQVVEWLFVIKKSFFKSFRKKALEVFLFVWFLFYSTICRQTLKLMSNKNWWNYWGVVILTSLAPPSQRLLLDSNVSWDPVSYKRHIQLEVEMWRDRLILFSSGGEAWSPCWSTLAFLVVFFSSTCNSDSVSKELLFRVALASWWDSWNCVLKAHRGLKNTIVLPPQKYVSPAGICLKSTLSNMFTWPRCSCNFLSRLNQICHMEPSSSGHCSCEQ